MDPLGGGDIRAFLSQLGLGGASQPLPALGSGYDADGNPIASDPSPYMAQLGAAPTVQSTGGPVRALTPAGQALVGGVADTLMAPGRAYNGQMAVRDPDTGHMTQDATDWGAGTALGMLGGSSIPRAPIAGPGETALGMFAGRTAKTADLGALSQAEKLAGSGAPREQIWNETGWFQGPDQQWRFEIPDNASQIGPKALEELNATGSSGATQRSAPGVLWHKDLYDAYPQMRQIDVDARYNAELSTENTGGTYMSNPPGNGGRPKIDMQLNAIAGPSGPHPTMLHELQHDIQQREGFAFGGDPSRAGGVPRDAQFQAAREAYDASAGDSALLRELGIEVPDAAHPPWDSLSPREQVKWLEAGRSHVYRNLAGEVEARNVETRLPLTPEQRRATPPWATQDVPDAQQIVRMGSDGPQMSIPPQAIQPDGSVNLGWVMRDVQRGALNGLGPDANRLRTRLMDSGGYSEADLPVRSMIATQDRVNADFGAPREIKGDGYDLPAVVKNDGQYFVADGHHRITAAAQNADTARVRLYDLDQARSGPSVDPRQLELALRKYGVSSLAALPPGVLATMGLGSDGQPDTRPQT